MATASDTSNLARELALEVAHLNVDYYIWFALITIVSIAVTTYVTSYFLERGKHYATKTDFEELKAQLSESTRIIEEIKTDVSQTAGMLRQELTLKQQKLETMMLSVYDVYSWLQELLDFTLFGGEKVTRHDPLYQVDAMAVLYLPELDLEYREFKSAVFDFKNWLIKSKGALLKTKNLDEGDVTTTRQYALDDYGEHHKRLLDAMTSLEEQSRKIMQESLRDSA